MFERIAGPAPVPLDPFRGTCRAIASAGHSMTSGAGNRSGSGEEAISMATPVGVPKEEFLRSVRQALGRDKSPSPPGYALGCRRRLSGLEVQADKVRRRLAENSAQPWRSGSLRLQVAAGGEVLPGSRIRRGAWNTSFRLPRPRECKAWSGPPRRYSTIFSVDAALEAHGPDRNYGRPGR